MMLFEVFYEAALRKSNPSREKRERQDQQDGRDLAETLQQNKSWGSFSFYILCIL
jgi:hypothetical protein